MQLISGMVGHLLQLYLITPSLNLAKVGVRATITFNISDKIFIIKDAWKFLCLVTNVVTPKLLCRGGLGLLQYPRWSSL